MTHFTFLERELPAVFEAAGKAEAAVHSDSTHLLLLRQARAHQDHVAIHKLRMNRALSVADLDELERMLVESGVGAAEEIGRAKVGPEGCSARRRWTHCL